MKELKHNIPADLPHIPAILPWLIAIAFFMQMLDTTILNVALPEIAKSINENPLKIQSVIIVYLLTAAFLLPLSGWMADTFGSKKTFILAIVLFTLGSFFCAISNTLGQLVLSRIFQGVGGALMVPVGRLIVIKTYPQDQLIKVLSFIMLPALIGPLLGPALGGYLVEYLSWHWIFLINIPFGIIACILCFYKMPDIREDERVKFDWIGFFLFSGSVILVCLASNENKMLINLWWHKLLAFIVAGFLFITYYFYAKNKRAPLFRLSIFRNQSFSVGLMGNLLARIGAGAIPFLTPLMLQVGLHISPSRSGLIMLIISASGIAAKSMVEKTLKTFGYRTFLMINTSLFGLLMCGFSLISHETPIEVMMILFLSFGVVNSLQFSAITTLPIIDLPKSQTSEGNTLLSIMIQVSMSLGVSIGAATLSYFSETSKDLLQAFHITYFILGIFTIFSAMNFAFTPRQAGGLKK